MGKEQPDASMILVYIILVRKNAEQLKRLVDRLKAKDIHFVLHLDPNIELESFLELYGQEDLNTHFMSERAESMGNYFGTVTAILNSLRFVAEHLPQSTRVTLLDDQDYPLKDQYYIYSFFKKNAKAIFIEHFSIPNVHWREGGISRFPNFVRIANTIKIFGGDQRWSFPMDIVKLILRSIEENPTLLTYFRSVYKSEESFFQTLLLNIDSQDINKNLVNNSLALTDWTSCAPVSAVHSLSRKDFQQLINSPQLFLRNLRTTTGSINLLNAIDKHVFHIEKFKRKFKQAFTFLTNKESQEIDDAFSGLRENTLELGKTYMLFHAMNQGVTEPIDSNYQRMIFDNCILTDLGYLAINDQLVPGNNHFALLKFYRAFPNFDYYWYIEDDVSFNGSWNEFFKRFQDNDISDLISSHVRDRESDSDWYWWESFKFDAMTQSDNNSIASFNPIFRISNRALKFVDKKLRQGWQGHHEVLLPTLLFKGGFTIHDFGGNGKFVPQDYVNKNYIQGIDVASSSMRFRPCVDKSEMNAELLYHPVKFQIGKVCDWQT